MIIYILPLHKRQCLVTIIYQFCHPYIPIHFIIIIIIIKDKYGMDLNMNEILVNDCTDELKVTKQQP